MDVQVSREGMEPVATDAHGRASVAGGHGAHSEGRRVRATQDAVAEIESRREQWSRALQDAYIPVGVLPPLTYVRVGNAGAITE